MGLSAIPEKRANQLANLCKGENGLKHKPKGAIDLKKRLKRALLEECKSDAERRQYVEVFIRTELARAIKGDGQARNLLWSLFEEDARNAQTTILQLVWKDATIPSNLADAASETD